MVKKRRNKTMLSKPDEPKTLDDFLFAQRKRIVSLMTLDERYKKGFSDALDIIVLWLEKRKEEVVP